MNRMVPFLISVILVLLICAGCSAGNVARKTAAEDEASVSVTVNGKTRTVFAADSAFPVTDVLQACGVTMNWSDDDTAYFYVNEQNYILDLSDLSIRESDSGFNIALPPPGTEDGFIFRAGKELFVDPDTMWSILYWMEIKADVKGR